MNDEMYEINIILKILKEVIMEKQNRIAATTPVLQMVSSILAETMGFPAEENEKDSHMLPKAHSEP